MLPSISHRSDPTEYFFSIFHLVAKKSHPICECRVWRWGESHLHHMRYPRTSSMCSHYKKRARKKNSSKAHKWKNAQFNVVGFRSEKKWVKGRVGWEISPNNFIPQLSRRAFFLSFRATQLFFCLAVFRTLDEPIDVAVDLNYDRKKQSMEKNYVDDVLDQSCAYKVREKKFPHLGCRW